MNDQVMEETIVTLHPDVQMTDQATEALRALMDHYGGQHPQSYWARLVSTPAWRVKRPEMIRDLAEREWSVDTTDAEALLLAELQVFSVEALAGGWNPKQCRISAVRIDGKHIMSLVCSNEGA